MSSTAVEEGMSPINIDSDNSEQIPETECRHPADRAQSPAWENLEEGPLNDTVQSVDHDSPNRISRAQERRLDDDPQPGDADTATSPASASKRARTGQEHFCKHDEVVRILDCVCSGALDSAKTTKLQPMLANADEDVLQCFMGDWFHMQERSFEGIPDWRQVAERLKRLPNDMERVSSRQDKTVPRGEDIASASHEAKEQQRGALTRYRDEAAKACERMVQLPLFAPWKLLAEQASHNFHFCIEFLHTQVSALLAISLFVSIAKSDQAISGWCLRSLLESDCRFWSVSVQGLLMHDCEGKLAPNDLSALISHLYFMEPSNFAFLTLLQSGHLAELCQPGPEREERVVGLLCHLFCRRHIPPWLAQWLVDNERTGPSLITLEKPSDEVVKILEAQTAQAVETLQDFWQAFVLGYVDELAEDDRLPLTGSKHGGGQTTNVAQVESLLLKSRVRSSFVALSGHDDCFSSVSDICNTTRAGLHIDSKV